MAPCSKARHAAALPSCPRSPTLPVVSRIPAVQGAKHFKDIRYSEGVTYGEMFLQNEYEMSGTVPPPPCTRLNASPPLLHRRLFAGRDRPAAPASAQRLCYISAGKPCAPRFPKLSCCFLPVLSSLAVYNLDEADVEGQRQRFELYNKVLLSSCTPYGCIAAHAVYPRCRVLRSLAHPAVATPHGGSLRLSQLSLR